MEAVLCLSFDIRTESNALQRELQLHTQSDGSKAFTTLNPELPPPEAEFRLSF